jgi:hypothetical protein
MSLHRKSATRRNYTRIAGKSILIAGLILFGYSSYLVIFEQFSSQSCPQFREGTIIIGWCGQESLLPTYLVQSVIVIVLGTLLYLWAKSLNHSSRDITTVATQIFLAVFAIFLISLHILMIFVNFHVDFYG